MDGGGADANGKLDLGFQQNSNNSVMSCSTSGMMTTQLPNKASELGISSTSMFKSSGGSDPFFEPHWNPLLAVNQNANYGGSSIVSHCGYANQPSYSMENQGAISSHIGQYPSSASSLLDLPKIHHFGSGNFSDMAGLYGLPALGQSANNRCYQNYLPNHEAGTHRTNAGGGMSQDDCQVSGERSLDASPNRKSRRRSIEPASALNPIKATDGAQQKDMSEGSLDQPSEQQQDKIQNQSLLNKQSGKQAKECSQTEDGTKDTYIHMRARRGQATNSHSLAERVRREKISERMKLLQELVPGCNKITGKAVMLDEIINYVQSLQQQVEFLSMKLATVNPELNNDIERMLSKEILHSRGDNPVMLGISPGNRNNHHPYPHALLQGGIQGMPISAAQYHNMTQNTWNNEFQSLLQMSFSSNPTADNPRLDADGCSKP